MKQCRICLEEDENIDDLISPCQCDGTQKYVHSKCLEKWRIENVDNDNYKRCQECLTEYHVKIVGSDSKSYYIYKNIIRYYYFFINKVFILYIPINYFIFLGIGHLIEIILGENNSFISVFKDLCSNHHLLYLPMITSFIYTGFILFTFTIIYFYLLNKDEIDWRCSLEVNIKKLNNIHFINLLSYFILPFFGFLMTFFAMRPTIIFFFEYFLSSYLKDTTKVIDLDDSNDSQLLIV